MSSVEAVVLAAGVGRRLRPFTDTRPKSLLEIGGRTLMERHLEILAEAGIPRTTIVVGHCSDQIRARFGGRFGAMELRYVDNPDYERGSILSLRAGLAGQGGAVIGMDADVLYHRDVLRRLIASEAHVCFLLDPTARETGEEMMLGVREGRVRRIARRVGDGWDLVGESVGFFRIGEAWVARSREILEDFVERGRVDVEYEEALNALIAEAPATFIDVGDLPWTEIDFPGDVEKANRILEDLRTRGGES